MTAYLVMQIKITDPKRWADYRDAVRPSGLNRDVPARQ